MLKNADLFSGFLFFVDLNVVKINDAFRGYAMSCKIKVTEKKRSNPIKQLVANKSSIKYLLVIF